MADLWGIARRDRWWVVGALLVSAPVSIGLHQQLSGPSLPGGAVLAAGIGLFLAIAVFVVRQAMDKRLRTESQTAKTLGLAVLAVVPLIRNSDERRRLRQLRIWSCMAAAAVGALTTALWWLR